MVGVVHVTIDDVHCSLFLVRPESCQYIGMDFVFLYVPLAVVIFLFVTALTLLADFLWSVKLSWYLKLIILGLFICLIVLILQNGGLSFLKYIYQGLF